MHNLVLEMTRASIDVKNMKMRVESIASRLEFNERRARALEAVVQYRPDAERGRDRDRDRDAIAPQRRGRRRRARQSEPGARPRAGPGPRGSDYGWRQSAIAPQAPPPRTPDRAGVWGRTSRIASGASQLRVRSLGTEASART